jgi:ribosomal protein L12E/L44/L45/RPP1/RPP2
LTVYLETLDCSIEEFYREVRSAQHDTHEEYIQYFIDCLLASTDYDSFYKVMSRHGSLAKSAGRSGAAPVKAAAKQPARKVAASKKGEEEEEEDAAGDKDSKGDSK